MRGMATRVYIKYDLNIFYYFCIIYMYKQKSLATSSSNITYGPSQISICPKTLCGPYPADASYTIC